LYGFDPFVEEAYKRFISKYEIGESTGFDFFNKTSLPKLNSGDIDNEVISETYMTEEEKRKRNHKIVQELKILYKNKCQVCGESIDMGYGMMYSEVHHIQPLGNEHNGIDSKSNMLVLCPNHHKMFDLGVLAIDPTDNKTLLHNITAAQNI
jgi:predicted restriction endonuclease